MALVSWSHDSPFIPGTLIRAETMNVKLEGIGASLDSIINELQTKTIRFPETFTGSVQIPEQTFTNRLLYVNSSGNLTLYSLDSITQAEQNTANSASSAAQSATTATGAATTAQGAATTATSKANEASGYSDNAANYALKAQKWAENNYNVEVEPGKYSAKHWAAVAETYAQQVQQVAGGALTPVTIKVGGFTWHGDVDGDHYVAVNAYYDSAAGQWKRYDVSKQAWLFQHSVSNKMPGSIYNGCSMWRCQPGANPVGPFNDPSGWLFVESMNEYGEKSIGGNGLEVIGEDSAPFGRFLHNRIGGITYTGILANAKLNRSSRDLTSRPSLYAGWQDNGATEQIYKVQYSPSGTFISWTDLMTIDKSGNVSFAGSVTADGSGLRNIPAGAVSQGIFARQRLGSGTPTSSTYLRGDGTWASLPATSSENYYVSSVSFSTASGTLTLNRSGLSALTVSLDGRYSLSDHEHSAANITTGVFNTARLGTGTATSSTFLRGDGTWATPPASTDTNYYVSSATFSTSTGVLTLARSGLSNLTVNLDGRYVKKTGESYLQSTGRSTSWGSTDGANTGAFNALMGTSVGATWLWSGTSNGVFRGGFQLEDDGNLARLYVGSTAYFQFSDTGVFTAPSDIGYTSDLRLKENLEAVSDAVFKVQQLKGITYTRKDLNTDRRFIGLGAQDVEKVVPEAVHESDGIKSVAYGNLVGLLVEAIKEQQQTIEQLKARVGALEELV